jgi:DNA processing protein
VEADSKSGSLISADQALDDGREVFAVPGPISSPKSRGTHDLIRNGAVLVTCLADIIEEIKAHLPSRMTTGGLPLKGNRHEAPLSSDEQKLLRLLSDQPVDIDQLISLTQFQFGHLHSVLLSLLMKKKIEQHAGSSYKLVY